MSDNPQSDNTEEYIFEVFLHPGDFYFGSAPMLISTLLGSCVAVTVWHPKLLVGGMCHILLPEMTGKERSMKYGSCAIGEFAKEIIKIGTLPKEYEIHVFGGADMFPDMEKTSNLKIGEKNLRKINQLLDVYGFTIKDLDTGGTMSRKVTLNLGCGTVTQRKTGKVNV